MLRFCLQHCALELSSTTMPPPQKLASSSSPSSSSREYLPLPAVVPEYSQLDDEDGEGQGRTRWTHDRPRKPLHITVALLVSVLCNIALGLGTWSWKEAPAREPSAFSLAEDVTGNIPTGTTPVLLTIGCDSVTLTLSCAIGHLKDMQWTTGRGMSD